MKIHLYMIAISKYGVSTMTLINCGGKSAGLVKNGKVSESNLRFKEMARPPTRSNHKPIK